MLLGPLPLPGGQYCHVCTCCEAGGTVGEEVNGQQRELAMCNSAMETTGADYTSCQRCNIPGDLSRGEDEMSPAVACQEASIKISRPWLTQR